MKTPCLVIPFLALAVESQACPILNGTFESSAGSLSRTVQIHTSMKDGQVRYRLASLADWLPADGRVRSVKTDHTEGTVSVTCLGSLITIASRPNGASPITIRISKLDAERIRVSSSAGDAEGIYQRSKN